MKASKTRQHVSSSDDVVNSVAERPQKQCEPHVPTLDMEKTRQDIDDVKGLFMPDYDIESNDAAELDISSSSDDDPLDLEVLGIVRWAQDVLPKMSVECHHQIFQATSAQDVVQPYRRFRELVTFESYHREKDEKISRQTRHEDYGTFVLETHVTGVYDGHGTDEVSLRLGDGLLNKVMAQPEWITDLPRATHNGFVALNDEILAQQVLLSNTIPIPALGGSTATTVFVRDLDLYLANVGDSRAIVIDILNGKVVSSTNDHLASVDVAELQRNHILHSKASKDGIVRVVGFENATNRRQWLRQQQQQQRQRRQIRPEQQHKREQMRHDLHHLYEPDISLAVSRAFGDLFTSESHVQNMNDVDEGRQGQRPFHHGIQCIPELHHLRLEASQRYIVVVASDGLWDTVNINEFSTVPCTAHAQMTSVNLENDLIAETVMSLLMSNRWSKAGLTQDIATYLADEARKKWRNCYRDGDADDVTVAVMRVST